MHSLVVTFIADDKPGLVSLISATIAAHEGNWSESSLSHLGGKFTGILVLEVPQHQIAAMREALEALNEQGFRLFCEQTSSTENTPERSFTLDLIGHDKPGIVRDISAALAGHQINVLTLTTELVPGSMSSELLFKAQGELEVPESTDLDLVREDLESIAADLLVDITLS